MRKSEQLGLVFPYDWSNASIDDEALIRNVLARGIDEDICRVCAHYGLDAVTKLQAGMATGPSAARMLSNIQQGFSRVKP